MATINEQLSDALHYEESLLAHALYLGIRHGYWKGDDPAESADFDKLDHAELLDMKEQNILDFRIINLYSVPLGNKQYAMIFSQNEEGARKAYQQHFKKPCKQIHHMDYGLDKSFYCPETKRNRTWREYRDTFDTFPVMSAVYQKD